MHDKNVASEVACHGLHIVSGNARSERNKVPNGAAQVLGSLSDS